MSFRIIHLADLHLDLPFRELRRTSSLPRGRREGLRQALKRAFDLARSRRVDAITIGGDLFEYEHVSHDTAQFLRQQFEQAVPIHIYIAPGNHDPYTLNSLYAYMDWPANVHIFREPRLTPIQLSAELQLWGAAHDSPAFYQPLLTNFQVPEQKPALLLLHGTDRSLTLGQDKSAFCPFSLDEVRASGFSLALLGHIHHMRLFPERNPVLCYPGSPEPLGFDEESGHSVLLAEWDGRQWQLDPVDISQWACRTLSLDLSGLQSREQVIEKIRGLWSGERGIKKYLARIVLTGQPTQSLDLDEDAIWTSLQSDFADLTIQDKTLPPFDLDSLKKELTTTGAFVRRMMAEIETAQRANDAATEEVLTRALTFGLLALEGQEIPNP